MKKTLMGLTATVLLISPFQNDVSANQTNLLKDQSITAKWSAEETHEEGHSTHLWLVNRAIDIMERNQATVHSNEVELLNKWKEELERGIYTADYENPYYDNYTFASHFYDPDTEDTYIPFASHAKETGAKYFKLAGEYYQKNDMEKAFFHLGLSLHYFGDINQPMHAANFTNLSYPYGFHSKYENFVDTIKENYNVSSADGDWDFEEANNPEAWIHAAALEAKKDYPSIVNGDTEWWFVSAAFSDYYAAEWRNAVTPGTGDRLEETQRVMAGFIHLWFNTYVNE